MHRLTGAYAMMAAAGLTLAAVHLQVWSRQPVRLAHLAFAMTATCFAALTPFELWMARAHTCTIRVGSALGAPSRDNRGVVVGVVSVAPLRHPALARRRRVQAADSETRSVV